MPANQVALQSEQTASSSSRPVRKRRIGGACDTCRVKKNKCDSSAMPRNVCTNCHAANIQCTHDLLNYRKKAEMQQAYILNLETRISKLEGYIQRLYPGKDIYRVIDSASNPVFTSRHTQAEAKSGPAVGIADLEHSIRQTMSSNVTSNSVSATDDDDDEAEISETEDLAHAALAEDIAKLSLDDADERYYGQSSVFMFARQALHLRTVMTGEGGNGPDPNKYRRHMYWGIKPWEKLVQSSEEMYLFPEDDLLRSLVGLYFERLNSLIPVLHKPTFMKSVAIQQHLWDSSFGMTVLMVCALGSRYSQDPRVLVSNDVSGLSSGWHFFCQVPLFRKAMLYKTSLYDLQYYYLAALYIFGTTMSNAGWILLGIGLRCAIEKGVHRRKGQIQPPSAEYELLKRVFWGIVCLDRIGGSLAGRPCAFPHETFDVEYPVECDDEYWIFDSPDKAFQQPPGSPCSVTAFVRLIKLCEILGFVLRTLYTNKKSRILSGFVGEEWERRMVAELDSSLNSWKDSLPEHLLWDPERQNPLYFQQSVDLHAIYYYIQIQTHRPFLTKRSPLTFSSFAICGNAARAMSHILEASTTRGLRIFPSTMTIAFTAGLVMILGMLGGKSLGYTGDPENDEEDLQKCVNVLKECEKRWIWAGRLRDMLNEVGALHEYRPTKGKRRHESFDATLQAETSFTLNEDPNHIGNGEDPSTMFLNKNPLSPPDFDFDLHRLFLTEMGYLPGPGLGENDTSLFNLTGGTNVYPSEDSAPRQFSSGNDIIDLWAGISDVPTPINGYENWDAF